MATPARYLVMFLILLIGLLAFGALSGHSDPGLAIAMAVGVAIGTLFYDRRRS